MKRNIFAAAAGAAVFALTAPLLGVFGLILSVCITVGIDLLTE